MSVAAARTATRKKPIKNARARCDIRITVRTGNATRDASRNTAIDVRARRRRRRRSERSFGFWGQGYILLFCQCHVGHHRTWVMLSSPSRSFSVLTRAPLDLDPPFLGAMVETNVAVRSWRRVVRVFSLQRAAIKASAQLAAPRQR